jgi:shikimate kinase
MITNPPEKLVQLIFLTGFMASGKSSLGKKASRKAGVTFLDLDELLEERTGKSVPEIFESEGEASFRKKESETLRSLLQMPGGKYLVACGGGTPCHGDNMQWMKTHGSVFYLRHRPGILVQRLTQSGEQRPLIREMNPEARDASIQTLIHHREKWYLKADYILQDAAISVEGLMKLLSLF